jgi:hypothetical protein
MLRTNSKQARENIARYIVDYAEEEMQEQNAWNAKDGGKQYKNVYDFVLDSFINQYSHEIRRRGAYRAFEDWSRGLPIGNLFCYYYNRSAHDDLRELLEESEAEAARYSEERSEEVLTLLIFRELEKRTGRNTDADARSAS